MKFGLRMPSFKKRLAARTSWKRVVRHNLGFKAPRGWGWLTNPKKAAYNRVYNRTTFSIGDLASFGKRSGGSDGSGCGCLLLIALGAGLALQGMKNADGAGLITVAILVSLAVALLAWRDRFRTRQAAEDDAVARQKCWDDLCARFGPDIAKMIFAGSPWQGATGEMIVAMLGSPVDVDEMVMKTKTRHVYKYHPKGRNRYTLRVTLENGLVVGWEDKS